MVDTLIDSDLNDLETLHMVVGQPLEIFLGPSEARTGYVWMVRDLPGCLALESTRDVPSTHPEHGRLPSRVLRVVGCHQGDGLLRCVLAQPWRPDDAAEERRYRMAVRL